MSSSVQIIALPATEIPKNFETEEELDQFSTKIAHLPFPKVYLSGFSHDCWLEYVISRLLHACEQVDALQFLAGQAADYKFLVDDEEGESLIRILSPAEVPLIRERLQGLLTWAQTASLDIAEILDYSGRSPAEIAQAFIEAEPSYRPNYEARYGEDGDSVEYLFCVLNTTFEILTHAQAYQLSVVYLLYQPTGGGAVTREQIDEQLRAQYKIWIKQCGAELGPEKCSEAACSRLHIKNSKLCQKHYYQFVNRMIWPFRKIAGG